MPSITLGGPIVITIIVFALIAKGAKPKTIAVFAVMLGVVIAASPIGNIFRQGADTTVKVTDAGVKAGEDLVTPAAPTGGTP